jgi:hypothetical protein
MNDRGITHASWLTEKLCSAIVPALKREFTEMYSSVKAGAQREYVIRDFQTALEEASKRKDEDNDALLEKIVTVDKCPWLQDVLDRTIQLFAEIVGGPVDVHVDAADMLGMCFVTAARDIWTRPYLLFDKFDVFEKCKNKEVFENIVRHAVLTTISDLVPLGQGQHRQQHGGGADDDAMTHVTDGDDVGGAADLFSLISSDDEESTVVERKDSVFSLPSSSEGGLSALDVAEGGSIVGSPEGSDAEPETEHQDEDDDNVSVVCGSIRSVNVDPAFPELVLDGKGDNERAGDEARQ